MSDWFAKTMTKFFRLIADTFFERWLVLIAQGIFLVFYFFLFVFFPKTAHRMIHYFEEEAVKSYTQYLHMVDSGQAENIPATPLAKQYYNCLLYTSPSPRD